MDKILIVSSAIVFKLTPSGEKWFITKQDKNTSWELPKTIARKGESSVRASMRMMSEQAGMRSKVLEEVGRAGGAIKTKGEPAPQRIIFYLLLHQDGEEILGFNEVLWTDYSSALKKLSKRDATMLKEARKAQKDIAQNTDRLEPEEEV